MIILIKSVIVSLLPFKSLGKCQHLSVTDLLNLSYSISERMLYKTGNGSSVLFDIETYLKKLKEVLRKVEESSIDGELAYAALKRRSGPAHINVTYVDSSLMEHFCWRVDDALRVEQLIENTRTLWQEIETLGDSKWNVSGQIAEPVWFRFYKPDPENEGHLNLSVE